MYGTLEGVFKHAVKSRAKYNNMNSGLNKSTDPQIFVQNVVACRNKSPTFTAWITKLGKISAKIAATNEVNFCDPSMSVKNKNEEAKPPSKLTGLSHHCQSPLDMTRKARVRKGEGILTPFWIIMRGVPFKQVHL